MGRKRVLVVGAGAAGSAAAAVLSQAAAGLDVVVVSAEDRPPYNRTTVNKGLLSGAVDDADIALPDMDLPGVTWRLGRRVTELDAGTRTVWLDDGDRVTADAVVLAVGADPRSLEVPDAAAHRVVTLRTAADTARLRALLTPGAPVLVAGAGLLGAESAGVLRQAGHPVVLVDAAPTPMAALLGSTVAGWVLQAHRQAGVDVRAGTTLREVAPLDGGHLSVLLSDGTQLRPGAVVAALGVVPATGWLTGSGVPVEERAGGIPVDARQRVVGWAGVYAAGDIAAVPGPDGGPVRVEHWGAALAQGRTAAHTALADLGLREPDGDAPAPELPGYGTYVHGVKLTILGWPQPVTGEVPLLGAPGDDRFAVALHDGDERLVAAVGVGGARAVNRLRSLLGQRAPVSELDVSAVR